MRLARGNREGGRAHADVVTCAQTYERALLRSLFEYVRAGDLDLAIDMCRQSDQSWRAASLSGGKLWWDPVLAPGEDGYEDEMDMESEEKRAKGTLNRRLWKLMCRKLAATVSASRGGRGREDGGADLALSGAVEFGSVRTCAIRRHLRRHDLRSPRLHELGRRRLDARQRPFRIPRRSGSLVLL